MMTHSSAFRPSGRIDQAITYGYHAAASARIPDGTGPGAPLRPRGRGLPRVPARAVGGAAAAGGGARRPARAPRAALRGLHARGRARARVGTPDAGRRARAGG